MIQYSKQAIKFLKKQDVPTRNFPKKSWDSIETVAPDTWDLKMLSDIASDPDCKEFMSSEDAMKELGL